MNISATIRDAMIRHVLQAVGSSLVAGGTITAVQEVALEPAAFAIIGGVISIFSILWGAKAATKESMVTSVARMPEVKRIVVNDRDLAAKTPTEVVYRQDMSIQ